MSHLCGCVRGFLDVGMYGCWLCIGGRVSCAVRRAVT